MQRERRGRAALLESYLQLGILYPFICSFISVITVKQTIRLLDYMIYWAMTQAC